MAIERINNIGYGYTQKPTALKKQVNQSAADNIQISEAARERAEEVKLQNEIEFFTKITVSRPEDSDRVQKLKEVKEKLKNGYYDNPGPEMIDRVAEKMVGVFFGGIQNL
ncbi:MAG: flagellar biosynthesis anti-sigma factor FlgM [Leptospiraceae bacterium]|nr:flagellar biosynthesis anti-sigma factor FlgM [Leptospiraceae bacterium]MCP5499308.1 flagellar biosynthesis anti-sigma factor FlgM [Leptospiraceae bacterium]